MNVATRFEIDQYRVLLSQISKLKDGQAYKLQRYIVFFCFHGKCRLVTLYIYIYICVCVCFLFCLRKWGVYVFVSWCKAFGCRRNMDRTAHLPFYLFDDVQYNHFHRFSISLLVFICTLITHRNKHHQFKWYLQRTIVHWMPFS